MYKKLPTEDGKQREVDIYEMLDRHKLKLYKYQKAILNDDNRFRIVLKSRQVGISLLVALESTLTALNEGHPIILVSASDRQALNIMGYVHQFCRGYGRRILDSGKSFINFTNGASIVSVPCSPDTIRTFHGDVYLDEFAFAGADNELYRAIQPTISRGYRLTVVSTPNGSGGKFYELWNSDQFSRHTIPWDQCPDLKSEVINEIKNTLDKYEFQQEYCCTFHDSSMTFLGSELIEACIKPGVTEKPAFSEHDIFIGYDVAKLVHGSVIAELERCKNGVFILRKIKTFHKLDYNDQLEYVKARVKTTRAKMVFVDASGVGQKIFEDLKRELPGKVRDITFTLQSKQEMMTSLWLAMQDGKLQLPNDRSLIDELHSVKRITTAGGFIRYEGSGYDARSGRKHHADKPWALAMPICYSQKLYRHGDRKIICRGGTFDPDRRPTATLTRSQRARRERGADRWNRRW